MVHYTDPGPERDAVMNSVEVAERILDYINETIREQEGWEILRTISQHLWIGRGRLDLTAPPRNMGQPKLLEDGMLCKAKSGGAAACVFVQ
ncbi:hypothetical protein BDZ89DRAFT_1254744 [Hymenopellis radicata]|nr:hypothetical protein BDZ89DRAFT_1254744 [Hymenopellis radicata]